MMSMRGQCGCRLRNGYAIQSRTSSVQPSMTNSLLQLNNERAVNLLRSLFVGCLDTVIVSVGEEDLADSLVAEGVLARPEVGVRAYTVASPLVDGLVRRFVIPRKFDRSRRQPGWTGRLGWSRPSGS